jgi:hypothetical protein
VTSARAALLCAVLIAGCGGSTRPFDRVALIPSYWDVVRVSGSAIVGDAPPVLTVGRSNSGRVALHCGEIDLRYSADTGGSTLTFEEQRVAAACQSPGDNQDLAVRSAIGAIHSWRVVSETEIEMLDAGGRAVLDLRMTTCNCPHQPPGSGGPTSS